VRATWWLAVLATAGLGVVAGPAHAASSTRGLGGARALAVSVPPDPVPVRAGSTIHTLIRVLNPNHKPVLVTITSRRLILGDNGKVMLGSGPDPRWQRLAHFPARMLRIPAEGYRNIPLAVRAPRRLRPDLYFIGFLVTPVATQVGTIKVINQIGSFVTIDVPGPRFRKLIGRFDLPSFVFGSHAEGTLRVTNTGRASVEFWGESDTSASPGGTVRQTRLDPYLLPIGRSRTITVSGKPSWPIGIVTVTAHITYPGRTEATTKELTFTKHVIVISIWVPIALGSLLIAAIFVWILRRRRRRADLPTSPIPVAAAAHVEPRG
jgi:hypothetical protein